jgi:hypothetical protein
VPRDRTWGEVFERRDAVPEQLERKKGPPRARRAERLDAECAVSQPALAGKEKIVS